MLSILWLCLLQHLHDFSGFLRLGLLVLRYCKSDCCQTDHLTSLSSYDDSSHKDLHRNSPFTMASSNTVRRITTTTSRIYQNLSETTGSHHLYFKSTTQEALVLRMTDCLYDIADTILLAEAIADNKLKELLKHSLTLKQAEEESKKGAFVYLIVWVGNEDEDEDEDVSTAMTSEVTADPAAATSQWTGCTSSQAAVSPSNGCVTRTHTGFVYKRSRTRTRSSHICTASDLASRTTNTIHKFSVRNR